MTHSTNPEMSGAPSRTPKMHNPDPQVPGLSEEKLAELRRLLKASSPGEWILGHYASPDHPCECRYILCESYMGSIADISQRVEAPLGEGGNDAPPEDEAIANGQLIIAMWNALPALLASSHGKGSETAPLVLDRYDAGLLGDGGGGNVEWWQDYQRAELDRAHEFYQQQADNAGPTHGKGIPAGWRPIDTAPKDGTHILAAWAGSRGRRCGTVRYTLANLWIDDGSRKVTPTHWMPLPPPPGPAQPDGEGVDKGAVGREKLREGMRFVCDGPPGHEGGRFVEVEDEHGRSFCAGEWRERPDGLWELVVTLPSPDEAVRELRYAQDLATYAAKKLNCVPEWRPLDEMYGVLTQIDNALTGLVSASAVRELVEAASAAVTFYDRAELPHMPGEATILDTLSTALRTLNPDTHAEGAG